MRIGRTEIGGDGIDDHEARAGLANRPLERGDIGELYGALVFAGSEHGEMMDAGDVRAEGVEPRPNRVRHTILRR
jgi:hypothetical protein